MKSKGFTIFLFFYIIVQQLVVGEDVLQSKCFRLEYIRDKHCLKWEKMEAGMQSNIFIYKLYRKQKGENDIDNWEEVSLTDAYYDATTHAYYWPIAKMGLYKYKLLYGGKTSNILKDATDYVLVRPKETQNRENHDPFWLKNFDNFNNSVDTWQESDWGSINYENVFSPDFRKEKITNNDFVWEDKPGRTKYKYVSFIGKDFARVLKRYRFPTWQQFCAAIGENAKEAAKDCDIYTTRLCVAHLNYIAIEMGGFVEEMAHIIIKHV